MTREQAQNLLKRFINRADRDKDPYLCVIFSCKEDKFEGVHERMDVLDAMIVIKELVKHFGIDELLLLTALK